jgi:hypothetical protein
MFLLNWATNGPTVHHPDDTLSEYRAALQYDRKKPKDLKKNLSQCHFVHHKAHMD